MENVLVLGAGGQLGTCIKEEYQNTDSHLNFIFKSSAECDIMSEASILSAVKENEVNVIVNCAAFTDVESSEQEMSKKAFDVNAVGPMILAKVCQENDITLIHISTDYVFDGKKGLRYHEYDECNPLNSYGMSKLMGENAIRTIMNVNYYIIRTSWLFSVHCKNSFKKMTQEFAANNTVWANIDEIGCPTSARDLAKFIIWLIQNRETTCLRQIIHFCNKGVASRYDVAYEIAKYFKKECNLREAFIAATSYTAKRPIQNVLANTMDEKIYPIRHWKDALKEYLDEYCFQI